MSAVLLPDRAELDRFVDVLFRHADPETYVVLKAYHHDGREEHVFKAVGVRLGDPARGAEVERWAGVVALAGRPAAFCPPVCTFRDARTARGYWAATKHDVANGPALSADADEAPQRTRAALVALLGLPTLEVASGGVWVDPETGELQDKLHLHWVLREPTRTPEDHKRLERARRLAAKLTGADATNAPLSHPLRWAGAVHNKDPDAPRHARIVAETDRELELDDALAALEAAWGDRPVPEDDARGGEPQAESGDVEAALAVIPNSDAVGWDLWKTTAMAVYRATAGGGFGLFEAWSAKCEAKHDPEACEVAWEQVERSPPDRIGFGSLVHRAREVEPGWRKPSERFDASRWFEMPPLFEVKGEEMKAGSTANDDPYPLIWHGDGDDEPLAAWLVDEMLFEVGTALLSGQWGTYKTFCALDLSAAVMVGGTFAGRQVKRKGGVLWLAVEGQGEIRKRLAAVAQEKIGPAVDGGGVPLDPARLPFVWVKACPKLSAPNALAEFGALISKAAAAMKERFGLDLALVIIDTLSPAAELKDADDTAENQHVMSVLKRTAQRFGTLVCAVDHMGKDTSTGTRNSSVKEADVDSVVALIGERDLAGNVAKPRVAMRKNRGAPTGWQAPFRTRVVSVMLRDEVVTTLVIDWGPAAEPQAVASAPPPPVKSPWTGNARILRDAMVRALDAAGRLVEQAANAPEVRAVDADTVRAEFYSTYPAGNTDAKRQAFNRLLKDAVARGLVASREIDGVDFVSLRSDHPQPAADQAA